MVNVGKYASVWVRGLLNVINECLDVQLHCFQTVMEPFNLYLKAITFCPLKNPLVNPYFTGRLAVRGLDSHDILRNFAHEKHAFVATNHKEKNNPICQCLFIHELVGGFNPSEKY